MVHRRETTSCLSTTCTLISSRAAGAGPAQTKPFLCASHCDHGNRSALIAFTELGARWLQSDASHFVFYVFWVALLFGIGEITRRVEFK